MARFDNRYSRLVAWLKVILPLTALAILSTLFLVSKKADPTRAIPYSEVEVAAILREQRIDRPDYSGVTRDGTAITMAATSARPETTDSVSAEQLRLRLETRDGGILDLTAGTGLVDTGRQQADLTDGVKILTSTGYAIETQGVSARLDITDVFSEGEISAQGPMGQLNAGQMQLKQHPAPGSAEDGPSYVLVFNQGVRLIYQPNATQGGGQ
ncbi:hypothetical protein [Oceaniglobus ichthyenteri]|uniref:hypothetical protein n=1 Tax=Oceaniglobus ichthyenteri TaxID=2136177 RepID=UPI000D393301|nr:hypothetical protein [Oceaniglobus ichthyenteri]